MLDYSGEKSVTNLFSFGILANLVFSSTIAVAIWALDEEPVSPSLDLVIDEVVDGGVGHIAVNNPTWEPRP